VAIYKTYYLNVYRFFVKSSQISDGNLKQIFLHSKSWALVTKSVKKNHPLRNMYSLAKGPYHDFNSEDNLSDTKSENYNEF
jgi:hypothetical protein